MDTQPVQYGFSQEAETSLGRLRDRIEFPMTMFGAAYLGYVGGLFEEGFEAGFPAWLRDILGTLEPEQLPQWAKLGLEQYQREHSEKRKERER